MQADTKQTHDKKKKHFFETKKTHTQYKSIKHTDKTQNENPKKKHAHTHTHTHKNKTK